MLPFSALSVTTNLLKHPKLGFVSSPKAAPTVQVSLSNANAQRESHDALSHSFIPFPSQPIQCARVSTIHDQDNFDSIADEAWMVRSPPKASDTWHMDICRSRANSCLSSSYVYRDGHAFPVSEEREQLTADAAFAANGAGAGTRKRKIAVRRFKAPTSSKSSKRQKKAKSVKKQVADMQFTATLHRSIAVHLRSLAFSAAAQDDLALRTQDQLLVERLWKNLVDQGLTPIPFVQRQSAALIHDEDLFSLKLDRVDHVFQTEPLHGPDAFGLPTPPSSPVRSSPVDAYVPRQDVIIARDAPLVPTTPPPTPVGTDADVLALPQLVASLILRHRDRSASRPRPGPSGGDRKVIGRSPLSAVTRGRR